MRGRQDRNARSRPRAWGTVLALAVLSAGLGAAPGQALESFRFLTPGAADDLRKTLEGASLLYEMRRDTGADAQDLIAAATADYGRILGALYAEGFYSGVIHIRIDGREASEIAPLDAPGTIRRIEVSVDPGLRFTFLRARMKPYARGTKLPPQYADGRYARATAIEAAATAGVEGWRNLGHAKARVSGENIVADHASRKLESWIYLEPGPKLRFGRLTISGNTRTRTERVAAIAGFPAGRVFSPEELDLVASRLRRTGVFRSVSLTEAGTPGPDGTLDIALTVVEEKKRRFGIGAEIESSQGLSFNGYWLHRNLFGGAERLRIDAAITGIGGQEGGGADFALGARIDRPATFTPDTSAFAEIGIEREDETDYVSDSITVAAGLSHEFSRHLTGQAALKLYAARVTDAAGVTDYRLTSIPLALAWDTRDKALNATKGFYIDGGAEPFVGFGSTGSGVRLTGDARVYKAMGDRLVLAGRAQLGAVIGPTLLATPRDFLFFSGGAGTVRGQPYQSLGVDVLRGPLGIKIGGRTFIGVSGEARVKLTDRLGVVGFYDAGYISALGLGEGGGTWQSGAGLGLRYDTGIGPIRFDVAAPVAGPTSDGVQFYVGIGQSF